MGLEIRYEVALAFGLGLLLLYLAGWLLLVPLKAILKLTGNSVLGALLLWIGNTLGASAGFHIGINPLTALTVGVLGVPGYLLLIVLRAILGVA